MSDGPEDSILIDLRRLDAKMDRVLDKVDGIEPRLSILETGLANVKLETAGLHHAYAALQVEMGRTNRRLDRIERRLDLQDARP